MNTLQRATRSVREKVLMGAKSLGAPLLLLFLAVSTGLVCVVVGNLAANRPVFLLVLPVMLLVGFMLIISPEALLVTILIIRGGGNPIFEEARFEAIGGLGGLLNLAVIILAAILIGKEPGRVPKKAYWIWFPFLLMQILGVMYSPEKVTAVRTVLTQCSTIALFLVAFVLVKDQHSFERLLKIVVISSIPVVIVTLIYIFIGKTAGRVDAADGDGLRFGGPFPHANMLAYYMVLLVAVVLYLWKYSEARKKGALHYLAPLYMLLLLALLALTKTRSAWIAAIVLFMIYGAMRERRYLIYMALGLFAAMFIPEVRDRIVGLASGNQVVQYSRLNSFTWRTILWTDAIHWMDPVRYVFGYGLDSFSFHSLEFFTQAYGLNWRAHSMFVQLFFELGVAGLGACIAIFVKLLLDIARLDRSLLGFKVIFGTTLVCNFIVSCSDNNLYYLVYNWYFWLVMGGVSAFVHSKGVQSKSQPADSSALQQSLHGKNAIFIGDRV